MEWIYPQHIQDQINGIDEQVEMLLKSKIRLLQNSVPKLLLTEEEVAKIDCDKMLIKLKPKQITNADRIRNMTDEELHKFINRAIYCGGLIINEQSSKLCQGCKYPFCQDVGLRTL